MRLAILAISALTVWALPSAVARAAVPEVAVPAVAGISLADRPGLTKAERTRRVIRIRRALRKCRTIRRTVRRRACARNVRRTARRLGRTPARPVPKPRVPVKPAPAPGKTWRVDVLDDYFLDYFSPDYLEISAGDSIAWVWADSNQNPHNVTLIESPPGVARSAYATPNAPSRNFRWVRRFDRPGTWKFACSLHHLMTMTVKVSKGGNRDEL